MNQDINNYEETTLASLKGLNNATEMQHARFTHNRPTVAEDLLPTLNRNQHQKSDKHKKDPSSWLPHQMSAPQTEHKRIKLIHQEAHFLCP